MSCNCNPQRLFFEPCPNHYFLDSVVAIAACRCDRFYTEANNTFSEAEWEFNLVVSLNDAI
ncbi:MAG: hypothetical protein ACRDEA_21995 [Microcystaceae cyanobacterium]